MRLSDEDTLLRKFLSAAATAAALAALSAPAMAHDYTLRDLKIGNPWSLPVPAGAPTAAGYLTVTNTGKTPDRLVGADVPEVDHVEIHEMKMDGAVMRMRPVPGGLVLPPGQTVALAPGGYHLMLIGPKRGFKVGEHIAGALRFEHAGTVKVEFEVQTAAPKGADDHARMTTPHMEMH
jgi:copper(I)-binding protein